MTEQGSYRTPSCPNCGESPMFRSQVHGCCVQVEGQAARLLAVREALFDTNLTPDEQVRAALRALSDASETASCRHPHPIDMVGCLTCGQVGPDDVPRLEVVAVLTRQHSGCILCVEGRTPADHALGDS